MPTGLSKAEQMEVKNIMEKAKKKDKVPRTAQESIPFDRMFQKLHAEGRTIIFVTHNPEIAQYSSRNIMLRDGKIREDKLNDHILSAAEALANLPAPQDD